MSGLQTSIGLTRDGFVAAIARRDATAARRAWTSDALLLPPGGGPVCGADAIEVFWAGGIELGLRAVSLEQRTIELGDDVAVETGIYSHSLQPEGDEATTECGNYLIFHQRQADGEWKWAIYIFNSSKEAWPPTADAQL